MRFRFQVISFRTGKSSNLWLRLPCERSLETETSAVFIYQPLTLEIEINGMGVGYVAERIKAKITCNTSPDEDADQEEATATCAGGLRIFGHDY